MSVFTKKLHYSSNLKFQELFRDLYKLKRWEIVQSPDGFFYLKMFDVVVYSKDAVVHLLDEDGQISFISISYWAEFKRRGFVSFRMYKDAKQFLRLMNKKKFVTDTLIERRSKACTALFESKFRERRTK